MFLVCDSGSNHRITSGSQPALQFLGLKESDLIGANMLDLVLQRDRTAVERILKPIPPLHQNTDAEVPHGDTVMCAFVAKPNELVTMHVHPLSPRTQGVLLAVQHALIDPVAGTVARVNSQLAEIMDPSESRSGALSLDEVVAGFDPQQFRERVDMSNQHGGITFERRLKRASGEEFLAQIHMKPVEVDGQKRLVVAMSDLSARHKERERLNQLRMASSGRAGDSLFDTLAHGLTDLLGVAGAMVVEHLRGGARGVTRGFRISGLQQPGFGYYFKDMACEQLSHNDHVTHRRDVQTLFPNDWLLRDNGAESYAAVAVRDIDKGILGHILVFDDKPMMDVERCEDVLNQVAPMAAAEFLREQWRHEREEVYRSMQAAQKLESLGLLAGGIAHDFNNLLTSTLGNLELVEARLASGLPVQDNLNHIRQSATRAAELCSQMLAYAGGGRYVVHDVSLNRLAEEMIQLLDVSVSKRAVLRLELTEDLPAVRGDNSQLSQVILNLVTNASDALMATSGAIVLRTTMVHCDEAYLKRNIVSDLQPGTYVALEVSDSGEGMTSEVVQAMFDPFFSTKESGRGLGLSAALGIIKGHGGGISVYSEPGKGTRIKVLLPAQDHALKDQVDSPDVRMDLSGKRVLVVDDDESVRTVLSEMLRHYGAHISEAGNGLEALDVIGERPNDFDLVLLDLTMPKLDGEATLTELNRTNPHLPIIMMSGYNSQEVTQRLVGTGAAGFIQKPLSGAAIREAMIKALSA